MLKQLLILLFILVNYSIHTAFAQDSTKTKLNKWGIGIQLNTVGKLPPLNAFSSSSFILGAGNKENRSFSLGNLASYSWNENIVVRLRYGMTKIDLRNTISIVRPDMSTIENDYLKEKINHFALGIQWNNSLSKKKSFFGGFEILYNKYGKYDLREDIRGYDISVNNAMPFTSIGNKSLPGGFSTGVSPYMGFTINITKNILICAEYSVDYVYSKIAMGDFTYEFTTKDNASGNIFYYDKGVFVNDSYKGWGISNQRASVNIIYLIY